MTAGWGKTWKMECEYWFSHGWAWSQETRDFIKMSVTIDKGFPALKNDCHFPSPSFTLEPFREQSQWFQINLLIKMSFWKSCLLVSSLSNFPCFELEISQWQTQACRDSGRKGLSWGQGMWREWYSDPLKPWLLSLIKAYTSSRAAIKTLACHINLP